ncbi:Siroheme synthase [compost metagenome]
MQHDGELKLPWRDLADSSQTLVFYMGLSNLGVIAKHLIEAGLSADTPAALISNGTRPDQHVARGLLHQLPTLALECPPGIPTLTVIGKVVDLFAAQPMEYPARFYPVQALQRHGKVAL